MRLERTHSQYDLDIEEKVPRGMDVDPRDMARGRDQELRARQEEHLYAMHRLGNIKRSHAEIRKAFRAAIAAAHTFPEFRRTSTLMLNAVMEANGALCDAVRNAKRAGEDAEALRLEQ